MVRDYLPNSSVTSWHQAWPPSPDCSSMYPLCFVDRWNKSTFMNDAIFWKFQKFRKEWNIMHQLLTHLMCGRRSELGVSLAYEQRHNVTLRQHLYWKMSLWGVWKAGIALRSHRIRDNGAGSVRSNYKFCHRDRYKLIESIDRTFGNNVVPTVRTILWLRR